MDIVKALHQRAAVLRDELGKIHEAIRAMTGTKIAARTGVSSVIPPRPNGSSGWHSRKFGPRSASGSDAPA